MRAPRYVSMGLVGVAALLAGHVESFSQTCRNVQKSTFPRRIEATTTALGMSTLTEETTWKLRFVLRGLPTAKGKKLDQIFIINAQFVEEDGYEPPQGFLKQVTLTTGEEDEEVVKSQFQIVSSRWILSEDPNDRKDGLWVWGLFKEPLYPFLLLQLKTDSIPMPGEEGDAIEPLALFAQISHKRDQEKGAILSRAELKIREMETVKADLFGVSTAELYEEKTIGQCVFQPLIEGN